MPAGIGNLPAFLCFSSLIFFNFYLSNYDSGDHVLFGVPLIMNHNSGSDDLEDDQEAGMAQSIVLICTSLSKFILVRQLWLSQRYAHIQLEH